MSKTLRVPIHLPVQAQVKNMARTLCQPAWQSRRSVKTCEYTSLLVTTFLLVIAWTSRGEKLWHAPCAKPISSQCTMVENWNKIFLWKICVCQWAYQCRHMLKMWHAPYAHPAKNQGTISKHPTTQFCLCQTAYWSRHKAKQGGTHHVITCLTVRAHNAKYSKKHVLEWMLITLRFGHWIQLWNIKSALLHLFSNDFI